MKRIEIEHDVPLPETRGRPKPPAQNRYPFSRLEVGESFVFPPATTRNMAFVSATREGKRLGRKFTVRQMAGKLRCWRTT